MSPTPNLDIQRPQSTIPITLTLNGQPTTLDIDPTDRLLDTLRYRLGLPGAKEGCGEGECGACTVIMDGVPVNSCLVPTFQCRGCDIRTIESIPRDQLAPMLETGATQCGACTPGVVVMADWVRAHPDACRGRSLRELMAGNLCRCTGYDGIIDGLKSWIGKGPCAGNTGGGGCGCSKQAPADHPGGTA